MKRLVLLGALVTIGCGASSPTAPAPVVTPPVIVVTPPPVPVLAMISVSPCPTAVVGVELGFYQEMGCGTFDHLNQPVRIWTRALKVYLRTVDEAGAPIDSVTLDTVQNAMIETAPILTNGRYALEGVLRGAESREGISGWVTVKWPATAPASLSCGLSDVARDGGIIALNYKSPNCGCNGSLMRPRTVRHELGHALGYYHTDDPNDLMSGLPVPSCDGSASARERQAIAYQYR